jgi:hypothetical protein
MKKLIFVLIAISNEIVYPQDFSSIIKRDAFDWKRWEVSVSKEVEDQIIKSLEQKHIDYINTIYSRAQVQEEEAPKRSDFLHFLDFSGDGNLDVLFVLTPSVWGLESDVVILIQNIHGKYVEVLEVIGEVVDIWYTSSRQPFYFRILNYGCCSDPHNFIEDYSPQITDGKLSYNLSRRILLLEPVKLPEKLFATPKTFVVKNDTYNLRYSPSIDDASFVQFTKGAKGLALAEEKDGTDRIWWFVLMDANNPIVKIEDFSYKGANSAMPADLLGWMSSRYLEEVSAK